MKFEHKYTDAMANDKFDFEYSAVTKTPKLGQCRWCGSFTKWLDVLFQVNVCSEECNSIMWSQYREDQKNKLFTIDDYSHLITNLQEPTLKPLNIMNISQMSKMNMPQISSLNNLNTSENFLFIVYE
jgi:hypothetical protein